MVPGSIPNMILSGICKQGCIFILTTHHKINEAEPNQQKLHQLLPGAVVIRVAVMVHLPADTTTTRVGTGMGAHQRIFQQPADMEFDRGSTADVRELGY